MFLRGKTWRFRKRWGCFRRAPRICFCPNCLMKNFQLGHMFHAIFMGSSGLPCKSRSFLNIPCSEILSLTLLWEIWRSDLCFFHESLWTGIFVSPYQLVSWLSKSSTVNYLVTSGMISFTKILMVSCHSSPYGIRLATCFFDWDTCQKQLWVDSPSHSPSPQNISDSPKMEEFCLPQNLLKTIN